MKNVSNSPGNTIVFFGSGPVAAKALELLQAWCEVEAVITKPQPAHHPQVFPVIDIAQKYELPLLTASDKTELDELIAHHDFKSQVAVLVDYGIIVSQAVIDHFELGIVNSHFSLLPEWRGADPITFSILSGQAQTGVSLMLLVPAMDEGPLLAYGEYDIPPECTNAELTEDLITLSDALLKHTLPIYLEGKIQPQPQTITGREVSYSRKLSKADGILDWNKPAAQLEREIRAFHEWPKSRATLGGVEVIITKAHSVPVTYESPGKIVIDNDSILSIHCKEGYLCVDQLKPVGKKEMNSAEFIRGYGTRLRSR